MKSLLIATGFPPQLGGIQTVLYQISLHLPSENIVVLTPSVSGDEEFDSRCQFSINRKKITFLAALIRKLIAFVSPLIADTFLYLLPAIRLLRLYQIDTIQCGHISVALVGFLLKKLYGTPYIIYTYAQEILLEPIPKWQFFDRALKRVIFRHADTIVTISEYTKRKIIQWGVSEAKIVKIPLGVDLTNVTDKNNMTDEIIGRLSLSNKRIILTVARLVERKGNDMVIKSLPMVLKEIPNIVYLVVGSGPMEERLTTLVNELNLQDDVIFCGDVSQEWMPVYYRICDVFIMPSRSLESKGDVEGFGIVFLEANAYGKPVIGGRSGGVPDAVLDGVTGLLVDPNSTDEIASAIIRLLTQTDYARELGENGRRRVESEMNWPKCAATVQQLLKDIVKTN
ncbi:MAG: glycosyltransferase family 4 protein [Anaerolineae bacterium]|nr:glycosyltransferase family 4 protein [Anaerolineae bacterium]